MTDITTDLIKLARQRCRDDVLSVTQLADGKAEIAAIMLAVAQDQIIGGAMILGISEERVMEMLSLTFRQVKAERSAP